MPTLINEETNLVRICLIKSCQLYPFLNDDYLMFDVRHGVVVGTLGCPGLIPTHILMHIFSSVINSFTNIYKMITL